MRLAVILPLLAACADSYGALSIDPPAGPPLGVGLVQRFTVSQDRCDGGVDGSCDPAVPPQLSVSFGYGGAVSITDVDLTTGTFGAQGESEGSAAITIAGGDGMTMQRTIDVVALEQTTLSVPRDASYGVFSPVHAFTNASVVFAQDNLGAGGTVVAGEAPLVPSSSLVTANRDTVTTYAQTGSVQITAALATLELDVVDYSALADFTIDGSPTAQVLLYTSTGTNTLSLLASDAQGQPIVGGGPDPTFTIGDPSLLAVAGSDGSGTTRTLVVQGLAGGNTTLQVTWGQVTKSFAVSIVGR